MSKDLIPPDDFCLVDKVAFYLALEDNRQGLTLFSPLDEMPEICGIGYCEHTQLFYTKYILQARILIHQMKIPEIKELLK